MQALRLTLKKFAAVIAASCLLVGFAAQPASAKPTPGNVHVNVVNNDVTINNSTVTISL